MYAIRSYYGQDQFLLLNLVEEAQVIVDLYDIMGRKVRTITEGSMEKGKRTLTLADLEAGAYFLRVKIAEEEKIMKIVRW